MCIHMNTCAYTLVNTITHYLKPNRTTYQPSLLKGIIDNLSEHRNLKEIYQGFSRKKKLSKQRKYTYMYSKSSETEFTRNLLLDYSTLNSEGRY